MFLRNKSIMPAQKSIAKNKFAVFLNLSHSIRHFVLSPLEDLNNLYPNLLSTILRYC